MAKILEYPEVKVVRFTFADVIATSDKYDDFDRITDGESECEAPSRSVFGGTTF